MSELNLDIKINPGSGKQTLGELRKEIKSLTSEVLQAEEGSKEFLAALNKLATAKDKLQDLQKAVQALDPGGRAAAFAKLGSTLASGFQAATGAMALFGVESEELQKQLLKVQAATAFAQGIQGLEDFGKQIKNVGNIIKLEFATNPFGVILLGVIALTTAIFAVANAMTQYTDEVDKLNDQLEEQKEHQKEVERILNNEITALTGVVGKEREVLELRKKLVEESINTARASIAVTQQKLKESLANDTLFESLVKLTAGEKAYQLTKFKNVNENIQQLQKDKQSLDELTAKLINTNTQITNFDKQEQDKKNTNYKKYVEDKKKIQDEEIRLEQEKNEIINAQILYYEKLAQQIKDDATKKRLADADTANKLEIEQLKLRNSESERLDKERTENERKRADARKQIQKDSFDILTSLGTIFISNQKKLEKFNKAAALTQLVVDTAQAISALVKNSEANPLNAPTGGIAGIAQFTAGIARILANIAKAKQLLSSVGETGSVSLSGASGGSEASSFTSGNASQGVTFPTNTSTTFQDNKPIKAYVVETELTASQRRIQSVENRATI